MRVVTNIKPIHHLNGRREEFGFAGASWSAGLRDRLGHDYARLHQQLICTCQQTYPPPPKGRQNTLRSDWMPSPRSLDSALLPAPPALLPAPPGICSSSVRRRGRARGRAHGAGPRDGWVRASGAPGGGGLDRGCFRGCFLVKLRGMGAGGCVRGVGVRGVLSRLCVIHATRGTKLLAECAGGLSRRCRLQVLCCRRHLPPSRHGPPSVLKCTNNCRSMGCERRRTAGTRVCAVRASMR